MIVEFLTTRQGWRIDFTKRFPEGKIDLLGIFPYGNVVFSTQLVTGCSLETLDDFLSNVSSIQDYDIFPLSQKYHIVGVWDKQKYLTPEFVVKNAYPILLPSIEKGIAKWLFVVRDPSEVFSILFDSDEVISVTNFPKYSSESLTIVRRGIEDRFTPPQLSQSQKRILSVALNSGFYDYPRKINLQELSKILNLAPSTVSYNLRKAGKEILHWYINRFT
ncbi:helix-turn-helix domain-containing protein [Thermococcus aggregans]|uniref:Helix-turn-helix domain-containing protein n=1 Tax=Thermococcus aggregans TaxID=110163 RepID=A0A9E7MW89_THEAG|nr:helix-turn-helix domain-containing protein [Thermococcus aggregans]USS40081.1 helix-turn-helix domain-containing protein [Thermococcus aggregans]